MANYTSLEAYTIFTPPSERLLFPSYIPSFLQKEVERQSSPSQADPEQVGSNYDSSVEQIPVRTHWETKSTNAKNYVISNSVNSDENHQGGAEQKESPQEDSQQSHDESLHSQQESVSPVQVYSVSPAQSQMYAMKRK
jgi:hypothetical protein